MESNFSDDLTRITIERDLPLHYISVDGALITYYDAEEKGLLIQSINSEKKGAGKKVVSQFISKVGADRKVSAPTVVDDITLQKLSELGITDKIIESRIPLEITDESVLSKIKLVRVFRGGGMKVDKVLGIPKVGVENKICDVIYNIEGHT